jgi:tRNA-Thr(GGU) m(6)t(6)A37 methyltransferase TsaA
METVTLTPIGHVRNSVVSPVDSGWATVESRIVLEPQWAGALDGLGDFSHVQIVTYLHKIAAEDLAVPAQRRPRGRADMPLLGVFAQRARVRPNPIGLTACAIVSVGRTELVVLGLDAIDGTPVLDIKPYVPVFDRVESPVVPAWTKQLFEGYLWE